LGVELPLTHIQSPPIWAVDRVQGKRLKRPMEISRQRTPRILGRDGQGIIDIVSDTKIYPDILRASRTISSEI
jgi:hypothetical protein